MLSKMQQLIFNVNFVIGNEIRALSHRWKNRMHFSCTKHKRRWGGIFAQEHSTQFFNVSTSLHCTNGLEITMAIKFSEIVGSKLIALVQAEQCSVLNTIQVVSRYMWPPLLAYWFYFIRKFILLTTVCYCPFK